jgi:hypothetical protein
MCFYNTAIAQELRTIKLDKDNNLFAQPSRIAMFPGDSLQFVAVDGDFDIFIEKANEIFIMEGTELKIKVNSSTNPESEILIIRESETEINRQTYSLYCITTTSWPDAPPKIIIVSH